MPCSNKQRWHVWDYHLERKGTLHGTLQVNATMHFSTLQRRGRRLFCLTGLSHSPRMAFCWGVASTCKQISSLLQLGANLRRGQSFWRASKQVLILNIHKFLIKDTYCHMHKSEEVKGCGPGWRPWNCKSFKSRWRVLDVQAMMTYTVMRFLAQAQGLALPATLSMLSYHMGLKSS